ncbi:MAG: hypothetical protein ACO38W_11215 [Phycisphaerales bacterium]
MAPSDSASAVVLAGLPDAIARLGRRASRVGSNTSLERAAALTRSAWQEGDTASPLVATGHQATFRHPGILVKDLVASAIADRLGGTTIRLLVDQDAHPIGPLLAPIEDSGRLRTRAIPCREPHLEAPTGRRPPIEFEGSPAATGLAPPIAAGIERLHHALQAHRQSACAASQVAAALDALAPEKLPPPIAATGLLATPIGLILLDAIADDPRRCAETFNEALRLDPRAARPLEIAEDRIEVPLWSIAWERPRERVHLDPREPARTRLEQLAEGANAAPSRLAPRGLLMTGLVRLVAARIINARGGWRYDPVTERWFAHWLGERLSPMAMATADWRLPFGAEVPSYGDLRRRWHDPQREGVAGPSEAKLRALRTIAAEPRRSAARREAFRRMHRQLDTDRRAAGIAGPPGREEDPAAVAASREWAFPLHDPGSMQRLAADARTAVFAAGVGHITR